MTETFTNDGYFGSEEGRIGIFSTITSKFSLSLFCLVLLPVALEFSSLITNGNDKR